MKITTKGRYGLRVLLDIATHQQKGPVTLGEIAGRQAISEKYLWQVVNRLKGAGLVSSSRGVHGGYILAREPQAVSLLDVVLALDGPLTIVGCVESPASCDRSAACVAREAWGQMEAKLRDAMAAVTLRELVDRQRSLDAKGSVNYMI